MFTGRPCGAYSAMQELFDKFSNNNVSGPVILQTLNMIVRCQQVDGKSPVGFMPWRHEGETRQAAAVRLISETLQTYAADPKILQTLRKGVIGEITTAFESYAPGSVKISESARIIVETNVLFDSLGEFVGQYVIPWCGKTIVRPQRNVASVQKTLAVLRLLISSCP